jgi:hypothetical protein
MKNSRFQNLNIRKYSGVFNMIFIAVGYYSFGPFLHSETWQEVRYRIQSAKDKLNSN